MKFPSYYCQVRPDTLPSGSLRLARYRDPNPNLRPRQAYRCGLVLDRDLYGHLAPVAVAGPHRHLVYVVLVHVRRSLEVGLGLKGERTSGADVDLSGVGS